MNKFLIITCAILLSLSIYAGGGENTQVGGGGSKVRTSEGGNNKIDR
jgi:hypothetical protein